MFEVKNLINSKFRDSFSSKKVIVRDITDREDILEVPDSDHLDLSMAAKAAKAAEDEMKECSTDKVIDALKEVSRDYMKEAEKRRLVCRLSGSVIKYVDEGIAGMNYFLSNADKYIETVFGSREYFERGKPLMFEGKEIARRIYKPKGMVGIVLPGNDVNISSFTLSQVLLSKNSCIVKPDTREPVSTYEFVKLVSERGLGNAIQMVCWSVKSSPHLVKDLIKHSSQKIVYGSDETIEKIACHRDEKGTLVADYRNEHMYRYGMGRSKAIVSESANLKLAARLCVRGAARDRGTKCISTKLVLSHEKIYENFVALLEKEASALIVGDPLDPRTDIGYIGREAVERSHLKIRESCEVHGHSIRFGQAYDSTTDLIIVEGVDEDSHLAKEELPIPIISLVKVKNFEEAVRKANSAVEHTPNKKSLIVSVFTEDPKEIELCRNIRAWSVSINKATIDINPFLPHQGRYIVEDLMKKTLVAF